MNKRLRKKKQLRKYSFSNLDIWNASYTMAEFIYELLVDFKRSKRYGYSASSPEEWEHIIDELIWTFGELRSDYKSSPYYRALDQGSDEAFDSAEPYDFAKNEDGTVAFKFLNEDIWDKYITAKVLDEEKKYRDRISKGLELFGRYFENLWD